jgi:hypothetical protein
VEAVVLVGDRDRAVRQTTTAGRRHEHDVELEPACVLGGDTARVVGPSVQPVYNEVDWGVELHCELASRVV